MDPSYPTIIFSYISNALLWFISWWWAFKLLSLFISVILIFGIIKYFIKTDYFYENRKYGLKKSWDYKKSYKKDTQKIWDNILHNVKLGDRDALSVAIKKADEVLVDVLRRAGYKGFNADQVLSKVGEENIPAIKELKFERSSILPKLNDENFELNIKDVKRLLRIYRTVLQYFDVIE